jgi:hypothetical protein
MSRLRPTTVLALALVASACRSPTAPVADAPPATARTTTLYPGVAAPAGTPVVLVLDGDVLAPAMAPTFFSATDINGDRVGRDQRAALRWFAANVGRTLELPSGAAGDEGFHAPTRAPASWRLARPGRAAFRNLLDAAPGLGGAGDDALLERLEAVRPLQATGLTMLRGATVCALVLAGEVGTDHAAQVASLQGDAAGMVAFEIVAVRTRDGAGAASLPWVTVRVRDVGTTCGGALALFCNPPAPRSATVIDDVVVRPAPVAPVYRYAP